MLLPSGRSNRAGGRELEPVRDGGPALGVDRDGLDQEGGVALSGGHPDEMEGTDQRRVLAALGAAAAGGRSEAEARRARAAGDDPVALVLEEVLVDVDVPREHEPGLLGA